MEDLKEFMLISPIWIPVITILMQVIKKYEKVTNFIPVIAMLLWIVICFIINQGRNYGLNIYQVIIIGFMIGWSSTGVYEAIKNFNKTEEVK